MGKFKIVSVKSFINNNFQSDDMQIEKIFTKQVANDFI